MIKLYYQLIKPGMVYGNSIPAIAAFFLADQGHVNWILFLAMLFGLGLIIAAACVFNNYLDRDIDARMARTKTRALASGQINTSGALTFGFILLMLGMFILLKHSTPASLLAALVGFVVYVFIYTPLKRRSAFGTFIGAIAGAMPPVVGYTAVTGKFDFIALTLFAILAVWQMPHFYVIAIRRLQDYRSANIPVWPLKYGVHSTKLQVLIFMVLFVPISLLPSLIGLTGYSYAALALILSLTWLFFGLKGLVAENDQFWAKRVFLFSLIILLLLNFGLAFGRLIP